MLVHKQNIQHNFHKANSDRLLYLVQPEHFLHSCSYLLETSRGRRVFSQLQKDVPNRLFFNALSPQDQSSINIRQASHETVDTKLCIQLLILSQFNASQPIPFSHASASKKARLYDARNDQKESVYDA